MLGADYASTYLGHRAARRQLAGATLHELIPRLRSLVVMGPRSEEAARSEHEQFWSALLQNRLSSLAKLVVPVACPELGSMVSQMCPALKSLQFIRAGSAINPHQNTQWARQLTKLTSLRHLDIASSNNEYEGCILSPELATGVSWNTPWLRTLYMSRIRLSTHSLETLLRMLPHLYALWFSFDAMPADTCGKNNDFASIPPASRRLRYLIIHAIYTGTSTRLQEPVEPCLCQEQAPSNLAITLAACLDRLPTLNRCRLPMFTYPDSDRHWLRTHFMHIDFNKYAPPY
ncbi:hypothetical protein IWW57_003796 [Coemansia sp. S610]|nr:hypothetical protein IWW57_003796 [Coemansia sp. S610]